MIGMWCVKEFGSETVYIHTFITKNEIDPRIVPCSHRTARIIDCRMTINELVTKKRLNNLTIVFGKPDCLPILQVICSQPSADGHTLFMIHILFIKRIKITHYEHHIVWLCVCSRYINECFDLRNSF